jgi:hypothetical protein
VWSYGYAAAHPRLTSDEARVTLVALDFDQAMPAAMRRIPMPVGSAMTGDPFASTRTAVGMFDHDGAMDARAQENREKQ